MLLHAKFLCYILLVRLTLIVLFKLSLAFLITIEVIRRLFKNLLDTKVWLVGPREETCRTSLVRVHIDCDLFNGTSLAALRCWVKVHAFYSNISIYSLNRN